MSRESNQSILQLFLLRACLPIILVMVLLATWLAVVSYKDYSKTYYDAHTDFERSYSSGNYAMGELESTRESAIRAARLKLNQYWVSCLFLVLAGVSAPLLTARHLTKLLQRNLDLLNLCITHPESDCEELQTQRFDLDEFDQTYQVVKESGRIQKEAELRSREAEAQLVEANDRLQRRAAELNQKSSDALSMMKEAELARAELERVNNRLNLAIGHAKESARQADTASKAKSDFLATMSHEIRTPLNGVIGFMEMLNMTELNEEQREYAESVKTSGEALMALINDVLDFSKIESGHLDLEARQFDLVATIRDTVSVFTSSCEKKGLKLIVDIEDGVPAQAVGDENRVRQILNNLLANSVKFTASGSITVKASNCSDASAPRCDIKLEVTDTGIGMSEAQLHRLFRPFAQGDSSMTRKFGGTGLGLAITKRLAEAMGGDIQAMSSEGQGATFSVRLNLSNSLLEGTKAGTVAPFELEVSPERKIGEIYPLRIVVAEDNAANQRVLMIMLKRLGWTAHFFDNGIPLLKHMREHTVDLVFMDLQMPIMDGFEATAKIRAGEAGDHHSKVTIIALTANALQGDEDRCLRSGMNAYLSKPIKLDVLKQKLSQLILSMGLKATI